jgi:hypothetical protein
MSDDLDMVRTTYLALNSQLLSELPVLLQVQSLSVSLLNLSCCFPLCHHHACGDASVVCMFYTFTCHCALSSFYTRIFWDMWPLFALLTRVHPVPERFAFPLYNLFDILPPDEPCLVLPCVTACILCYAAATPV